MTRRRRPRRPRSRGTRRSQNAVMLNPEIFKSGDTVGGFTKSEDLGRKMAGGTYPNTKISKCLHQIWFSNTPTPAWREYLFHHNKTVCERNGWTYKLWTQDMRTKENFPLTFDKQEQALAYGPTRYAQVADLARLELIFREGGVYMDSLFEISDAFIAKMNEIIDGHTFLYIGANEDPCGLECSGYKGRKYITNGFFAAPHHSKVLRNLLTPTKISTINLSRGWINRTTGPYYLRSGITKKYINDEMIYLFNPYTLIYPFNVNPSNYRKYTSPNQCLSTSPTDGFIETKPGIYLRKNCLADIQSNFSRYDIRDGNNKKLSEKPLTIYHSGLGGTWSPDEDDEDDEDDEVEAEDSEDDDADY